MRKKNNLQLKINIPDGEGSIALPIVFVHKPVTVWQSPIASKRRFATLAFGLLITT